MPVIAITILRAIGAALFSILTKVLSEHFIERIVASVTFVGLSKLASRSSNSLDDSLVHDAAEAYYGEGQVPTFLVPKDKAPASPIPAPVENAPSEGTTPDVSKQETPSVEAPEVPAVATPIAAPVNQEADELKELR